MKFRPMVFVIICVAFATSVWASTGPDSLLQNELDQQRAKTAHGHLFSWDGHPLGNRHAWLLGEGMNSYTSSLDGMPESAARILFDNLVSDWQTLYKEQFGHDLFEDVAIYVYCYNSDRADPEIAHDLDLLIEGNWDLTQASIRMSACGHSKMGNILFCYWAQGGRKLGHKVTLDAPGLGAPFADRATAYGALQKTYGVLAGPAMSLIDKQRALHWQAAGQLWMTDNYPPMIALRKTHPLDDSWYLYGSTIEPLPNTVAAKIVNVGLLADALVLRGGFGEDPYAYKLSALLIENSGVADVANGNDGTVTLDSALCRGYSGTAHIRREYGYNHSEILQGKGQFALHQEVLADMVDFNPLAARDDQPTELVRWVPETPDLSAIWVTNLTVDLSKIRCAGWDVAGRLILAESQWQNPTEIQFREGRCVGVAWWGESLVVTVRNGLGTDLYRLDADGHTLSRLTNDGGSAQACGSSDGAWLVYISGRQLMLRSTAGMTKSLVGGVSSDLPAHIDDKTVWWYQGAVDAGYQLYSVAMDATDEPISKVQRRGSFKGAPFMLGKMPLYTEYLWQSDLVDYGNKIRLVPDDQWRLEGVPDLYTRRLARVRGIGKIDQVAVDSESGETYLRFGETLRFFDPSKLTLAPPVNASLQAEEARRKLRQALGLEKASGGSQSSPTGTVAARNSEFTITSPFDSWAPVRQEGVVGFAIR